MRVPGHARSLHRDCRQRWPVSAGRYVEGTKGIEKGRVYDSSLRNKHMEQIIRLSQREVCCALSGNTRLPRTAARGQAPTCTQSWRLPSVYLNIIKRGRETLTETKNNEFHSRCVFCGEAHFAVDSYNSWMTFVCDVLTSLRLLQLSSLCFRRLNFNGDSTTVI